MDPRTRTYLEGRFGDHYRRITIPDPPDVEYREWGYIPWTDDGRTRMIRHHSIQELGDLGAFLETNRPRHVYYSAGYYADPGANRMDDKGWKGADLIFDLDADHLPGVDPSEASYGAMLKECKRELQKLLSFLQKDFGFDDLMVVFSGGRGYHVHVRQADVLRLSRESRREIVDYIRGEGISLETITKSKSVRGSGRQTPATTRQLETNSGWSRRIHSNVMTFVDYLRTLEEDDAVAELKKLDGIGKKKAESIVEVIESRYDTIRGGNIDVHPAFITFVSISIEQARSQHQAAIDEPVTTDVNRLIRLPGSLHGGSGLAVRTLDSSSLASFDPLSDAIPETFTDVEIAITLPEQTTVEIGGKSVHYEPGTVRVPEYIGIHLMARGQATKAPEKTV